MTLENKIIIGDATSVGEYQLHSAFEQVCNFFCDDKLIFISNDAAYLSPASLILEGFDIHAVKTISITSNDIFFNNQKLKIAKKEIFNSFLTLDNQGKTKIINTCKDNYKKFLTYFPAESLGYIFEGKENFTESESYKMLLKHKIFSAIRQIEKGEIKNGIANLKGIGYGLTPSGDDFITGMLYGMHFFNDDLPSQKWREQIYDIAKSKNIFVNNNLIYAKNGNYNLRFKNFLLSLLKNDMQTALDALKCVISIGATSGADLLIGFIFAILNLQKLENNLSKTIL